MVCLFFYLLVCLCFLPLTLPVLFYKPFPMSSFLDRNPVPQSRYRYIIFSNTLVSVFPVG